MFRFTTRLCTVAAAWMLALTPAWADVVTDWNQTIAELVVQRAMTPLAVKSAS
jgi:hypothetical protein